MKEVEEIGEVVELDGKFWGIIYKDGHETSYGWVDIKNADLCTVGGLAKLGPAGLTYKGSHLEDELSKGRVISIKRTTSYEIL